ncbi:hypothetical protein C8F01DRAFT_1111823 [Mycena amicta]|nr:hypothetical protein C8F01DRAFT_1111823 [Mycena amicta]
MTTVFNWAVFVTATGASPKDFNRALLLLQDFEFEDYPPDNGWVMFSSNQVPTAASEPTRLPIEPEVRHNDFAGMSLADINTFVRENGEKLEGINISGSNWAVIDQRGLETSTCLVCEKYYDDDGNLTDDFRACRLPNEPAWSMITSLSTGQMMFEDYIDDEAGVQDDGSWRWATFPRPPNALTEGPEAAEVMALRQEVYDELKAGGYVD